MSSNDQFNIRERIKYVEEFDWPETREWMRDTRAAMTRDFATVSRDYTAFTNDDFPALEESIAINVFGITEDFARRAYNGTSLLRYFNRDQRRLAMRARKKMEKIAGNTGEIEMQIVPICVRMDKDLKRDENDTEEQRMLRQEYRTTGKIIVFRVKGPTGDPVFLDCQLRIYATWNKYLEDNRSPQCIMCYPIDGFLLSRDDNRCANDIEFGEPPSCKSFNRFKEKFDTVLVYVSPVIALSSLFCPATWVLTALALEIAATGILIYSLVSQGLQLHDQIKHCEDYSATLLSLITSIGAFVVNVGLDRYSRAVAEKGRGFTYIERVVITGVLSGLKASQLSSFVCMTLSLASKPIIEPMDIVSYVVACNNLYSAVVSPWTASKLLTKVKNQMQAEHRKAIEENTSKRNRMQENLKKDQAELDELKKRSADPIIIEKMEKKIQGKYEKIKTTEERILSNQNSFLDNKGKWMENNGAQREYDTFRENAMNDPDQCGSNTNIDQNGRIIKAVTYMDAEMIFEMVSITGSKIRFSNGETMDLLINSQLDVHPRALDQMNRISKKTGDNNLIKMMEVTKKYTENMEELNSKGKLTGELLKIAQITVTDTFQKNIKPCLKEYQMITRAEIKTIEEKIASLTKNEAMRERFKKMTPGEAYRMRTVLRNAPERALDLAYRYAERHGDTTTNTLADWVEIVKLDYADFIQETLQKANETFKTDKTFEMDKIAKDKYVDTNKYEKFHTHKDFELYRASRVNEQTFFDPLFAKDPAAFNAKAAALRSEINRINEIAQKESLTMTNPVAAYYQVQKHGMDARKYFNSYGNKIPVSQTENMYFTTLKDCIFSDGIMGHFGNRQDKFISQDGSHTSTIYRDGRGYFGVMKCSYDADLGREVGKPIVATHFPKDPENIPDRIPQSQGGLFYDIFTPLSSCGDLAMEVPMPVEWELGAKVLLSENTDDEDEKTDIFQDAKDHMDLLIQEGYEFEDVVEYLDKDSIFKEPPGLLGMEEYQIAVAKFITHGISWNDTAAVFFNVSSHPQVEKTVRRMYFTALAEEVQHRISELITVACCQRQKEFYERLNAYEKPDITSKLWEDLIDLLYRDPLVRKQLLNFKDVDNSENDKHIQKLWKKTVANWLQLINTLVPHFFDDSVERQLLSCIFNWFTSGEMSHSQFNVWKKLLKKGKATSLKALRQKGRFPDEEHAKVHVSLFKALLDDVETNEFTRIDDFEKLLISLLTDPVIRLDAGNSRLQVIGKGFFLSDVLDEILVKKIDSVKEVNIFSKYFLGIDCNLENKNWHGVNFTIVTDQINVWKKSVIDVSGIGYPRAVRGTAPVGSKPGEDGKNGVDGRPGESGGNVAILTKQLRNAKNLTVKLNGGSGEGGQNGGKGAEGRQGIMITESSFLKTIPSYDSLFKDNWSSFLNYKPGLGWSITSGDSINTFYEKWIYREYEHTDGRKMIFSFAGDGGWLYDIYDIMFIIKGTDGSMGGFGGEKGVAGEGGKAGEFKAKYLMTGSEIMGFGQTQKEKGLDGDDAERGDVGDPGKNGNHMAMIDRSAGSWTTKGREKRKIYGKSGKSRLEMVYELARSDSNALNGMKKYRKKDAFSYTAFTDVEIPTIDRTDDKEKRKISTRLPKTQAKSKQTISIETLLEEFAEIFEGDEVNVGDISVFKNFEIEITGKQMEEEQIKEETSIVRNFVENNQKHEKNLRQGTAKPEEVIKEIKKAVRKSDRLTLVKLISIWKKIFSVPLNVIQLKKYHSRLMVLLCNEEYVKASFNDHLTLPNGMSFTDVALFTKEVKTNFAEKQQLSSLKLTLDEKAAVSRKLDSQAKDLTDVMPTHLEAFWMEVDREDYKNGLIRPFFKELQDNHLDSIELLKSLYKINISLKTKDDIFKPFRKEGLNWADIPAVKDYLKSFLTEKEKKALAEKEKKEADMKLTKEEKKSKETENIVKIEASENTTSDAVPETPSAHVRGQEPSIKSDFEMGEEIREDDDFCEQEKTSDSSFFPKYFVKEVSQAFKNVADAKVDAGKLFSDLTKTLNNDCQKKRFCIEKSFMGSLLPPGSTPQSLVHMYYLSEQILNYNVKLYRYYLPFEKRTTISNDWYDEKNEVQMKTVEDLVQWAAGMKEGIPIIDSTMEDFMKTNGIRCRSYRQMVADTKMVNIRMFCDSGYCQMRLVENLNPTYHAVHLLIIKDGELKSIGPNVPLRTLRAVLDTAKLNLALPESILPLGLASYFPDSFQPKVIEWTEAAIVATGSEKLPRFFQRLFELRGNSMSMVDFQFAINTLIEANRNFNIPLESLCCRILTKNGKLLDIFLALRVTFVMKGAASQLDPLMQQLSQIHDSRLKALFGSKLYETPFTNDTLTNLINMLAHAEDQVAQLQRVDLKEWINIASCQKWKSYAPLLKSYGTVGYYIVLLETLGNEQGQGLKRIINKLMWNNKTVIILEKHIAMLTFFISNNEVEFNDSYESTLYHFLLFVSQKCTDISLENIYKLAPAMRLLEEAVRVDEEGKSGTIHLIRSEVHQKMIMEDLEYIRKSVNEEESKVIEAAFPREDRTLEDLIRLCVNPQDTDEVKKARQKEMKEIKDVLAGGISTNWLEQTLANIDNKLYELYEKRLRDTQKIAILSAFRSQKNRLSQANTGEGKSFIISCLALLKILANPKDTVDIITSQSVLAQRDAETMRKLYNAFGIDVGHNCDEDVEKRKLAYKCGVVYGDIARFERDYLLQTFYAINMFGERSRCNVIVDEVDSMLLDNGGKMLYLSHNVPGLDLLDSLFVYLHKLVNTPSLDEADAGFSSVNLRQKILSDMCGLVTKEDVQKLLFDGTNVASVGKVWRILVTQLIIDSEGVILENWDSAALAKKLTSECGQTLAGRVLAMLQVVKYRRQEIGIPSYLRHFVIAHLDEFIKNVKQGLFLKHKDEYVVDLDRTGRVGDLHPVITIIDKGTGTDLSTSQWSEGLHQFLQLKHGCRLTPYSLKAVFISNVSYLKQYKCLYGFSGTLGSVVESNSLVDLYNADLLKIPTWKPKKFNEKAPVLSPSKEAWAKDIFDEICDQMFARRSVLVICQSIKKVEELEVEFKNLYEQMTDPTEEISEALKNVTAYKREFEEVDFEKEGVLHCCRIIIATNLAGRGTDIALSKELVESGGLHVIVSFLPENSRIENQAYGRAARCGQPGSGQIICFIQEENSGSNNIFQQKQLRDNAEVHRLISLNHFYSYHIAVEETALKLFKDHCSAVMKSVHQSKQEINHDPTIMQVIYFALLDEWAVWLDSKAEEIKQCEKNKNDVLKNHIIGSVNGFLATHPLPKVYSTVRGVEEFQKIDYSESLKWIKCPQPLLSIALIHLKNMEISEAEMRLDQVIMNYPDFQAEACYYKGVIEQWKIREALQQQPAQEEKTDVKGNPVPGELGIRLKTVNWVLRNVLYSDDCPDSLIQLCMESVKKSTAYFQLSRSLFATRIRKKHEMTRIVKLLQQNVTNVASRGFAFQQEEAIAVLECFIGSIDDILGHRAKPEDVELGGEAPHLKIRRFREMIKRADIITPPQLANYVSEQQLRILSNNHCLPVAVLKNCLQKMYNDTSLKEYEGQKIVSAEELAKVFLLPSVRGFWESLRRAGCFLSEQVFIAVKKSDKEKVAVLKDIQPTKVELNSLQVLLSAEDLTEYDLFDVHGPAKTIRENDTENAELQEAQEAGTVHPEILATLNLAALSCCQHLDQFAYLTLEVVAVELQISPVEAEWIMETLVNRGIVEKRLAEIELPPTPEELDAMNKLKQEEQSQRETGEKRKVENDQKGQGSTSSAEDSGIEEERAKPKATCVAYFPVARISCDFFPSNMRSSIWMMLIRNFSYHYALTSLKKGMIAAQLSGKAVSSHQISLPTDPYADLCEDLQSLGVVQHSRVTNVLKDIYEPKIDGTVIKCSKNIAKVVVGESVTAAEVGLKKLPVKKLEKKFWNMQKGTLRQ